MSEPISAVYICDVDLNPRYEHTIYFPDPAAQESFFVERVIKTYHNFTFLRKTWSIKVDATLEQARAWSYLYTRNTLTGSINYYFITGAEYINPTTVELSIELDVMQTYMFNVSLNPCYVEREHAATDNPGDNLVDEGLDTGDLVTAYKKAFEWGNLCVLVMATIDIETSTGEQTDKILCANYNSMYWGTAVYAVDMSDYTALGTLLIALDDAGKSDSVVSMWMYPKGLLDYKDESRTCKKLSGATYKDSISTKPTTVGNVNYVGGDYEPRNKKLLTYPFNMMYVCNNTGGAAVYHYERFLGASTQLRVYGTLSAEGGAKLIPMNYNGSAENVDEALAFGGFPTCSWNQDVYKLWLAQNQNSQKWDLASAGLRIGAGVGAALSGNVVGGAVTAYTGLNSVFNTMAQRRDMAIQPPQAKGAASPSANVTAGCLNYTIMQKSVTGDRARMIDDFFDMYGYKTCLVKVPNKNHRAHWWYTKTINCKVSGSASAADMAKIESIYDKGITFWRDGTRIGNYTKDNIIV